MLSKNFPFWSAYKYKSTLTQNTFSQVNSHTLHIFFNQVIQCRFHYNMVTTSIFFNPLPNDSLDSSKLKDFADDNFKFDENGRKLSKSVENTVGKGEIAHHEQFLFFPQCFQKACFPGASKGVIVWERVNTLAMLTEYFPVWSAYTSATDQFSTSHSASSPQDSLVKLMLVNLYQKANF